MKHYLGEQVFGYSRVAYNPSKLTSV